MLRMSDFRLETLEPSYEGDGSILDDKISFLEHVSDLQPQAVPVSIPPKVEPYGYQSLFSVFNPARGKVLEQGFLLLSIYSASLRVSWWFLFGFFFSRNPQSGFTLYV